MGIYVFEEVAVEVGFSSRHSLSHLLLRLDQRETTFVENKLDACHRFSHLS